MVYFGIVNMYALYIVYCVIKVILQHKYNINAFKSFLNTLIFLSKISQGDVLQIVVKISF